MKTKTLVCFLLAVLLTVQPVAAWNAHGQRVIASIAFLRLEPATRLAIADRIRNHPRFVEDFEKNMPTEVRNGDAQTQAEWIFQKAAVWPDTTRRLRGEENKEYDHATWHYIDQITYLNPSDELAIGPIEMNLSTTPPAEQTEDMNAVQAIEFARLRVNGTIEVTPEQDALMLCWLLHVYSDVHQPLHSTEIFSKSLLPEGCNGGNLIRTKQSRNLHVLWDGLLGNDDAFKACHNQAVKMMADKKLAQLGKVAATITSTVDVVNESHEVCKRNAFADEVRAHLQRLDAAEVPEMVAIDLTDAYLKQAGRVATEQACRAGWRLGEVLK